MESNTTDNSGNDAQRVDGPFYVHIFAEKEGVSFATASEAVDYVRRRFPGAVLDDKWRTCASLEDPYPSDSTRCIWPDAAARPADGEIYDEADMLGIIVNHGDEEPDDDADID